MTGSIFVFPISNIKPVRYNSEDRYFIKIKLKLEQLKASPVVIKFLIGSLQFLIKEEIFAEQEVVGLPNAHSLDIALVLQFIKDGVILQPEQVNTEAFIDVTFTLTKWGLPSRYRKKKIKLEVEDVWEDITQS